MSIIKKHTRNKDSHLDKGGVNESTAVDIRTHLDNNTKHRLINDAGSGESDLWSANKIDAEINSASTALTIASEKIANFTAVKKELAPVDVTTIPITVTPPAAPVTGDIFAIVDSRFNSLTNNITVDFTTATQNLYASLNNWIINEDGGYVEFIYINATIGWVARK